MNQVDIPEYHTQGALRIQNFATRREVEDMRSRMSSLIDSWEPDSSVNSVFRTTEDQHLRNEYLLDSSDKISFFLEEGAVLSNSPGKVRLDLPKSHLINKAGHGLHILDDVFKQYTHSGKVIELVSALGYTDPIVPQSMYIFKQPVIGGAVTAHQDSTFLYTEPQLTCLGLWLALDDADESNGCLWYRPGSHKEPLRRRLIRNPGGSPPTKFVHLREDKKYDGTIPENLRAAGFIPLPVRAGDLVVIHGSVDHLSLPNTSEKPRHSFQLHLVEGPGNAVEWSKENWLQYTDGNEFIRLSVMN
jgi:phytanoyl-CoA hydroxylase